MSALLSFYRGESANPEGRSIAEIWTWDYSHFENVHPTFSRLFRTKNNIFGMMRRGTAKLDFVYLKA